MISQLTLPNTEGRDFFVITFNILKINLKHINSVCVDTLTILIDQYMGLSLIIPFKISLSLIDIIISLNYCKKKKKSKFVSLFKKYYTFKSCKTDP